MSDIKGSVRFVPSNCFSPNHEYVKSWVFPYEKDDEKEMNTAFWEANFADSFARLAANNGMDANEIHRLFPAVLRMLKSKSNWAK